MATTRNIGVSAVFDLKEFNEGLNKYLAGLATAQEAAKKTAASVNEMAGSLSSASTNVGTATQTITGHFVEMSRIGRAALFELHNELESLTKDINLGNPFKQAVDLAKQLEKQSKEMAKVREDAAKRLAKLEEQLGKERGKAAEKAQALEVKLQETRDKATAAQALAAQKLQEQKDKAAQASAVAAQKLQEQRDKATQAAARAEQKLQEQKDKTTQAAQAAEQKLQAAREKTAQVAAVAEQKLQAAREKTAQAAQAAEQRLADIKTRSEEKAAVAAQKLQAAEARSAQQREGFEQKLAELRTRSDEKAAVAAQRLQDARSKAAQAAQVAEQKLSELKARSDEKAAVAAQKLQEVRSKAAQAAQVAEQRLADLKARSDERAAAASQKLQDARSRAAQAAQVAEQRLADLRTRSDEKAAAAAQKLQDARSRAAQAAQVAEQKLADLKARSDEKAAQAVQRLQAANDKAAQQRQAFEQRLADVRARSDEKAAQAAQKLQDVRAKAAQAAQAAEQRLADLKTRSDERAAAASQKLQTAREKAAQAAQVAEQKLADIRTRSDEKAAIAAQKLQAATEKTAQQRQAFEQRLADLRTRSDEKAAQAAERLQGVRERAAQAAQAAEQKLADLRTRSAEKAAQAEQRLQVANERAAQQRQTFEQKLADLRARSDDRAAQAAQRLQAAREKAAQAAQAAEQKLADLRTRSDEKAAQAAQRLADLRARFNQQAEVHTQRLADLRARSDERAQVAAEKLQELRNRLDQQAEVHAQRLAEVRVRSDEKAAQAAVRLQGLRDKIDQQAENHAQRLADVRAKADQRVADAEQRIQALRDKLAQQTETHELRIAQMRETNAAKIQEAEVKLQGLRDKLAQQAEAHEQKLTELRIRSAERAAAAEQKLADTRARGIERVQKLEIQLAIMREQLDAQRQKNRQQDLLFEERLALARERLGQAKAQRVANTPKVDVVLNPVGVSNLLNSIRGAQTVANDVAANVRRALSGAFDDRSISNQLGPLDNLDAVLKQVAADYNQVAVSVGKAGRNTEEARKLNQDLAQTLRAAGQNYQQLVQQLQEAARATQAHATATGANATQNRQLVAALQAAAGRVQALSTALLNASAQSNNLANGVKVTGNSLFRFGNTLTKLAANIQQTSSGLKAAQVAMGNLSKAISGFSNISLFGRLRQGVVSFTSALYGASGALSNAYFAAELLDGALGAGLGAAIGTAAVAALRSFAQAVRSASHEIVRFVGDFERFNLTLNFFAANDARAADATLSVNESLEMTKREAEGLMLALRDLAIFSPFTNTQINQIFRTAIGYGLTLDAAKELVPLLVDVGAAAGLNADVLERVALALAQVEARGKLTGEEIRQFGNAGVPIRRLLVNALNLADEEFDELVETGAFTAKVVMPILTNEFKRFEGAARRASLETTSGLLSSLQDLKEIAGIEIFTAALKQLQPILRETVDAVAGPKFSAALRLIGEIVGRGVAGAIEYLRSRVGALISAFLALDPVTRHTIFTTLAFAAAITTVIGVIGLLTIIIPRLITPFTLVIGMISTFSAAWVNDFNGIRTVTERVVGDIIDLFSDLVDRVSGYGQNIAESLAAGIQSGVNFVVAALGFLGQAITYLLIPGSPPRLLPDLDKWGKGAADAYLEGFTQADLSIISDLASGISSLLSSLASSEQISELTANHIQQGLNKPLAEAAVELAKTGNISKAAFDAVVNAAGPAGEEIAGFLRHTIAMTQATSQVTAAQDALNAVTEKYKRLIDPISERLEQISNLRTARSEAKEIEKLRRIISSPAASQARRDEAQLRLEEILLQQQLRVQEKQRDTETEAAEAALTAAEKEEKAVKGALDAFKERLKLQSDAIGLRGQELQILERMRKEEERLAKEAREALFKPFEDRLKGLKLQSDEIRDQVRLFELRRVLEDKSATVAQKAAAALEIQQIHVSQQIRDLEAAELDVPLEHLRQIKVVLADIEKDKDKSGMFDDYLAGLTDEKGGLDIEKSLDDFDKALKEVRVSLDEFGKSFNSVLDKINLALPPFLRFRKVTGEVSPVLQTVSNLLAGFSVLLGSRALVSALKGLISLFTTVAGRLNLLGLALTTLFLAWSNNWFGIRDITKRALDAVTSFINDRAIPSISNFGTFLTEEFGSFEEIGKAIIDYFTFKNLGDAIGKLVIRPFLYVVGLLVDEITDTIRGATDLAVFLIEGFGKGIGDLLHRIIGGFGGGFVGFGVGILEGIAGLFTGQSEGVLKRIGEQLRSLVGPEIADAMILAVQDLAPKIGELLTTLGDLFTTTMDERIVPALKDAGRSIMSGIFDGIQDFFDAYGFSTVSGLVEAILNQWRGQLGIMQTGESARIRDELGKPSGDGFLSGFKQYIYENADVIARTAIDLLVMALKRYLGIASPSTLMASEVGAPSGEGVITGMANAIQAGYEKVREKLLGLITFLFDANTYLGFLEGARSLGASIVGGINEGITGAYQGAKDTLGGFLSGLLGHGESEIEAQSPSKLFARRIGRPIGEGVNKGIGDATNDQLVEAIRKIIVAVFTDMKDDSIAQVVKLRNQVIEQFQSLQAEGSEIMTTWQLAHIAIVTFMQVTTSTLIGTMRIEGTSHLRGLRDEGSRAMRDLRDDVVRSAEDARDRFIAAIRTMATSVITEFNELAESIQTAMETITTTINDSLFGVGGVVETLQQQFKSEGQILGETFGDGIELGLVSRIQAITEAAVQAVNTASVAARNAILINFPPVEPGSGAGTRSLLSPSLDSATANLLPQASQIFPSSVSNSSTNIYNLNVRSEAPSQGTINDFNIMRAFSL